MFVIPRPEESAYSILARAHVQLGSSTPAESLRRLTGIRGYKPMSGLPTRGEAVLAATGMPLTVDSWIHRHTLFPLFRPFLPKDREYAVRRSLIGSGCAKSRIGILRSHCGASEQLAFCERCTELLIAHFGHSYWLRSHLLPGVRVCARHQTPLTIVNLQQIPWKERALLMPIGGNRVELNDDQVERLHFLALQINAILAETVPIKLSHEHYREALSAAGLLTQGGRLRGRWLSARIRKWLKPIRRISPFDYLFEALDVERNWATVAVSCEGGFTHPLKHATVWGSIGCSWQDLVTAANKPGHQLDLDLRRVPREQPSSELMLDVFERCSSLRVAAAELGCDVTTAVVHAARLGINYKRRPKKVTDDVRAAVLATVRDGITTKEVAKRFGLSITTVNRIRRSSSALENDLQ